MPEYRNGELLLSSTENEFLLRWLAHPDSDTLERRDGFLTEIDTTLRCEEADGGVWVEFLDTEELPTMSITDKYLMPDDGADDVYRQIPNTKKDRVYVNKPPYDHHIRKEQIRYSYNNLISEKAYSFLPNCA